MQLLGVRRVADLGMHHVSSLRTGRLLRLTVVLQINTSMVETQIYIRHKSWKVLTDTRP